MASESPWAVLAERLDGWDLDDSGSESWSLLSDLGWVEISIEDMQDLLIGRTLRVAHAHAIEHGKIYEYILTVDMVTQSNPEYLAEHCLRLLDAVGYPASS
jgi:hypothetical protein